MKTIPKFKKGERVEIIGKNAPFPGEKGIFLGYENEKVEQTRLIIKLDSTKSEHWFLRDELRKVELLDKAQKKRYNGGEG